jgi:hypothetical protein
MSFNNRGNAYGDKGDPDRANYSDSALNWFFVVFGALSL